MKALKFLSALFILTPFILISNTIIVDQNGNGDLLTIQDGINYANSGDTVLVYPGNYIEVVDFIGKDIVVGSLFLTTQDTSYISQTIIDGNYENLRLVRFTNGETNEAVLIGFTITRANEGNSGFLRGLGIYIEGSSPVIRNNRVINNYYDNWYFEGGGIVIENSSAKIINNIIRNNDYSYHGGGIYVNNCINLLIQGNSIDNNTAFCGYGVSYGAGVYINSSQNITIKDNIIWNNKFDNFGFGNGLYISHSCYITILSNIISSNRINGAEGGGLSAEYSTDIYIIDNLFYNNKAEGRGGGIHCYYSDILLVNNTIVNNETEVNYGLGGGIYCNNSNPVIVNSILYSNTAGFSGNQVYLDENSDPDFYYCDIEGGLSAFGLNDTVVYDGTYENNIETDPLFLLSGEYPYSLDVGSPCINAGNPDTTGLYLPVLDLAGNQRIIQDTIDIGAYEYQLTTNIGDQKNLNTIFLSPNPASDNVFIHFPGMQFQGASVAITDLKGGEVLKIQVDSPVVECNLSSLPKGIYIVKIACGNLTKTEKLIHY